MATTTPAAVHNSQRIVTLLAVEIRAEMMRQGHTLASAAEHLCIAPQAVGRKLNGHRGLSLSDLVDIADWLGVSAAELMARAEAAAKRPTSKRRAA